MAYYSKDQLRSIFQNKFNQEAWKSIVVNIFGAGQVRRVYEKFTSGEDLEDGYFLGSIDTPDSYRIGLFYYRINSGSVAHKKVGFRNLLKKWVNPNWGEFEAAIVVFDDGDEWRLSFICDIKEEATAPKRFTYVFGEKDNFYKTPVDRFEKLQTEEPTFANIRKTFSVDALSDDFFDDYRELYADFVEYITGKRYVKSGSKWEEKVITRPNHQFQNIFEGNDKLVRDYIKKMFGRIVFLYFLQRKGWLNGNKQYMHDLFYNSSKKDDFLDGVLEPLFFEVLNEEKSNRTKEAKSLPGCDNIPYLNGGLFARDEIDERTCVFPADYFKRLFDFLDSYNFTIDENDTDDAEIGIDPEMLGRIFENLLEDNKDKGAFYTPKEIVDYMCRESLIAYLIGGLPEIKEEKLRNLVENLDTTDLSDKDKLEIRKSLQKVKICDPAIGSGAFPMGLVNLLSKIYVAMKTDTDTAKMKRHIMEQNIYGVDIEKGAVDIARLRFWLAMIVEEKEPIPLPNLHFKIMQGNSLLESYNGIDLSDLTNFEIKIDKKGQFEMDFGNNNDRMELDLLLKRYYNTSNHTERDSIFKSIIKNVNHQLKEKNVILPEGEDPSANNDFFLWHTWFSDVFANGGFDIVIGNPPYVLISKDDPNKPVYDKIYEVTGVGKRNLYHLFFEKGISILKHNGVLSYITPDTYLAGNDTLNLRKYFRNNIQIQNVILYSEQDKVFENVTQAVAVTIMIKGKTFNDFTLIVHNEIMNVSIQEIDQDPKLRFRWSNKAIKKIKETKSKIGDYFNGNQGDINLTTKKAFLGTEQKINSLPLIRGNQIAPFVHYGSNEWCDKEALNKDLTKYERIIFQEVANAIQQRRIKAIILKDVIIGHSANYLLPKNTDISIKASLAILNSKVINFYFKFYNQTNHVPIGDIKLIPFPTLNNILQMELEQIVIKILDIKRINQNADIGIYENQIDKIVFHLYNLTYDEILIIDPDTPISREEYENFKADTR